MPARNRFSTLLYCTIFSYASVYIKILQFLQLPESLLLTKAAGTGPIGQAKTGPPFSAYGWVMIVYCLARMVKIVT